MCGRYQITVEAYEEALAEAYELPEWPELPDYPLGDMNPGSRAVIITAGEGKPVFREGVWGFPGKDGALIFNARSESAALKPSFASSFESRRCLVPAGGFYEWDSRKNKVYFDIAGSKVIYLAAVWKFIDDAVRFVILTTDANSSMQPVHDRMPLIIGKEDMADWLGSYEAAVRLLRREMPALRLRRDEEQLSFI